MNEWDDQTLALLKKALVSPAMLAAMNGITAGGSPAGTYSRPLDGEHAPADQSTTAVALVQDGIAHRPHRTDGERVQVACRVEGSLPLELFDVQLIHHVRPELRCALCFLTPVVVVCQPHLSWMPKGQDCPDCKRLGPPAPKAPLPRIGSITSWGVDPGNVETLSFDGSVS